MKKFFKLISLILFSLLLFSCEKKVEVSETVETEAENVNPRIEISISDFGKLQFELDPENAPLTVENFLKLVNDGFYDGLTFHRIIPGFIMQGGDPNADGTGGASEMIKGEFGANGVDNRISHLKGVISMARNSSFDSGSSQFFICLDDTCTELDDQFAAFGTMLNKEEGFKILDDIGTDIRVLDDNGTVNKHEQPVIEYIKEIK